MRFLKSLVAVAAVMYSANVYAATIMQYTFTGAGSGVRDNPDKPLDPSVPALSFQAVFYVDLEKASINSNGLYDSDGKNNYFSFGPGITELTSISLTDGVLKASSTKQFPTEFSVNLDVDFGGSALEFANLMNGSNIFGGNFSYSNVGKGGGESASGKITGFSARSVDGPLTTQAYFTAVPEPTTWGMMLAGFVMVGCAARRRRPIKTTVRYA